MVRSCQAVCQGQLEAPSWLPPLVDGSTPLTKQSEPQHPPVAVTPARSAAGRSAPRPATLSRSAQSQARSATAPGTAGAKQETRASIAHNPRNPRSPSDCAKSRAEPPAGATPPLALDAPSPCGSIQHPIRSANFCLEGRCLEIVQPIHTDGRGCPSLVRDPAGTAPAVCLATVAPAAA